MAVLDIEKDPQSILDYGLTWDDWLDTDTIVASTWSVPTGLTSIFQSFSDTEAVIWLSGGTLGSTYEVTNHITTNCGREEDRTIIIIMRPR